VIADGEVAWSRPPVLPTVEHLIGTSLVVTRQLSGSEKRETVRGSFRPQIPRRSREASGSGSRNPFHSTRRCLPGLGFECKENETKAKRIPAQNLLSLFMVIGFH
jgi:hypothetical protein